MAEESPNPLHLQTVANACKVMLALAKAKRALGVRELGNELGLHPTTAAKLLATLREFGLVRQEPIHHKYELGMTIFELAASMADVAHLRRLAAPHLQRLRFATGETVHLMVPQAGEGVYVDRLDSPQTVRMVSYVGKREALHCSAVGKALLAHLGDDEVAWILGVKGLPRFTPQTITDPKRLQQELERVREQGYAIDDQEGEEGIRCVGAPVFDWTGRPVAGVSVSAPAFRTPVEKLHEMAPLLLTAVSAVSALLGHDGKPAQERTAR